MNFFCLEDNFLKFAIMFLLVLHLFLHLDVRFHLATLRLEASIAYAGVPVQVPVAFLREPLAALFALEGP